MRSDLIGSSGPPARGHSFLDVFCCENYDKADFQLKDTMIPYKQSFFALGDSLKDRHTYRVIKNCLVIKAKEVQICFLKKKGGEWGFNVISQEKLQRPMDFVKHWFETKYCQENFQNKL